MARRVRATAVLSPVGWTAAGLIAVLVVFAAVVPSSPWVGERTATVFTDLDQLFFAALAAATTVWRAARARGRSRAAWGALAGGCAAWAAGQALWSWYELVADRSPFPSAADAGFLLFPVGASLFLWLHGRTRLSTGRRHVLDSLTVAAALSLLSWASALGPVAHAHQTDTVAFMVSLAYPATDLMVLVLLAIVLTRSAGSRGVLAVVATGVALITVADSAFALLQAGGGPLSKVVSDTGWAAGFAVLALSPLARERSAPEEAADAPTATGPSMLPYVPVLLAALVVGTEIAFDHRPDALDIGLSALTVVLVLVRQYAVVRENARLVAELSTREGELRHQAFHDGLTGLANRALFRDRVAHALDLHRRDLRALAVLFCDLDDFKLVNDTLGHHAGDELLGRVAERLRGALRAGDTLARLGGDEFAVLIEDGGDPWAVARQVVDVMSSPYSVAGSPVVVQASVGLTVVAAELATPTTDVLLAQADTAMYAAKRAGKGCFRAFEPGMELEEVADVALRRRLGAAIANRRIRLAYQPIVRLDTGHLAGFEALARWHDDDGTVIPPDVFIAAAERTGLIADLTELLLDDACAQLATWDRLGARSDFTVAVNVSTQQIVDRRFPGLVLDVLRRHGVAPERLVLEITETALLSDLRAARFVTGRLRAAGVAFSLDDFGTGYSSLTHLNQIPLQSIKIDRLFVAGLGRDEAQDHFTEALLRFARDLDLEVIAEGIERHEQLERLHELGCDHGQGFLLGRASDPTTWDAHLLDRTATPIPLQRTAPRAERRPARAVGGG